MSDEPTERDVEALGEVIADAICGEKPSYSPDQACLAHRIQAERAAAALAPLLAQARREGAAEALEDAVDRWQFKDWSNVLLPKPAPPAVPVIAYSNRVLDWLRDRAAALRG